MKFDRGRLFVAGGNTGNAYVYARNGALIRTYALSTGGSFINDVVVTKKAAWFTDSLKPGLYRVPLGPAGRPGAASAFSTVNLTPPYVQGSGFNVNGIDSTPNGKTLVIVQSSTGLLFTVNEMGGTRAITLAGGESVPNGDGILLDGKTLYVVQNRLNVIAKIALSPDLRSGRVLRRISSPDFDVPTTVAELGSRLYAVNARFGRTPTPTTEYSVVQVAKRDWVELIAGGRVNRAPATCRPAGCRCERRDQAVGDSLPGSQRRAQVGGRRGTRPVRP